MIECVFTLDYEIYGNGEGSLQELIYEPADKLMAIFMKVNARFVTFVEIAELEMINKNSADTAIGMVMHQIRDLHREGFELGLHLHPQWCNSYYEKGVWTLDLTEYNLCSLATERIAYIIDWSLDCFRNVLGIDDFTPLSFRAGNWLLQPTYDVARLLSERGVRIDSSVFKGGVQRLHNLDYRRSLKNGYFWKFTDDVNLSEVDGKLLELPIHTRMVPFWEMYTPKRLALQRSSPPATGKSLHRLLDFVRLRYPLKFDFCRMTIGELRGFIDAVLREDQQDPASFRPIVAIGHTKDLIDFETVELLLSYLEDKGIPVSTFEAIYARCGDSDRLA